MVLELVIRRVLELKHELVKWNPPNVDVRFPPPAPAQPFPWDYVNLDDILVDLKLSPDTLDVAVPRREETIIHKECWSVVRAGQHILGIRVDSSVCRPRKRM